MSLLAATLAFALTSPVNEDSTPFDFALNSAQRSIESGNLARAKGWIWQALERDAKSIKAWDARARWAEAVGDEDELVYSLHRMLQLAIAQEVEKSDVRDMRIRVEASDPLADDLLSLRDVFVKRLIPLAETYAKDRRPHSAIAVYREVLGLDPENEEALLAIEELTSLPDPSLAEDASEKDLFADVSDEWIAKHDAKHAEWSDKAKYKSEYYNVYTDAGYRILIQSATAMDEMHVFYKQFFQVDGSVPRIDLNIFKNRSEYLKKGIGPPIEWSGGHFTGNAVETYVGAGGFQETLGTLFHEAAHQFVNAATSAGGWLNEGLASFFEGTRLLPNGTVLMNLPADHRLFPLASRMERGWMADEKDGTSAEDANRTPSTAPTFNIVLANKYQWGPPWYAPTWGVVYWSYNYQDPKDGRFIYRDAFLEFINKSGGRTGESAVGNFADVVLANPQPPTKGVETSVFLPQTVDELNDVWKKWIIDLRDERIGAKKVDRPYLDWGKYATERKEYDVAKEHFEKGLAQDPNNIDLLTSFADLLADEFRNEDRASKLVLQALRLLENAPEPDERAIKRLEKKLYKWDDDRKSLDKIHSDLWASAEGLVQRYLSAERYMMTMDLARRLTTELKVPGLMPYYEEAWRRSGKNLDLWKLAYNEKDLAGWSSSPGSPFQPNGSVLESKFGRFQPGQFSHTTLPLEVVTIGDYSMEVELLANPGEVAFGGIVFGMKNATTFNGAIFLPGKEGGGLVAASGFVDLGVFSGTSSTVLRHVPVVSKKEEAQSKSDRWIKLRLDVTGPFADVYIDGQLKFVHEFPSRENVAGSLGLLTGPGTSRYRNVRYITRSASDPGAALERNVIMSEYLNSEGSINGSWLGKVPPFPKVQSWLQNRRKSWQEAGPVPQLLAMWSIRQNDLIPINDWLTWLADQYSDIGLQIVSVGSVEDSGGLERYLLRRQFPGAVGLDGRNAELGDTFEDYSIESFNLPRLILLDIDGTVVWEGDPGFHSGRRWAPGIESFLKPALDALIDDRGLRELAAWRERWHSEAVPAMFDADFVAAEPLLREAGDFEARGDADVFEAQNRVKSLTRAVENIDTTIELIARTKCDAALETLLEWGEMVGATHDKRTLKKLKPRIRSQATQDWEKLFAYLKSHSRRIKKDGEDQALEDLLAHLAELEGRFPELVLDLLEGVPPADVLDALEDVERIPALWLAREYFNW